MKTIDVFVPKEDYEAFVSNYENAKVAIDSLSVAVKNRIIANRKLLKRDLIKLKDHQKISIPIQDHLLPYVNEYCVMKGLSKQELIVKIMKGKNVL